MTIQKSSALSFQSIGVTKDWRPVPGADADMKRLAFPFKRRHQRMATIVEIVQWVKFRAYWVFQSIGVTKDWRLKPGESTYDLEYQSFQSVGVSKDCRQRKARCV